jgi:phytoene synthase
MVPILEPISDDAYEPAKDLGIAFQLANFIRDVGEDLERGRIYLPIEDLTKFDITVEEFKERKVTRKVKELLKYEIARVRDLERSAIPGIKLLSPASQPCIDAARILYCGIVDAVEEIDYQVFDKRAKVGLDRRLKVAGQAWLKARKYF